MDDDNEPIIMDIGSGHLKAGFANDDAPKCYVPMIVGIPKHPGIMVGMDQKDAYFGEEALSSLKKSKLNLHYPVQNGYVTDIDLLKDIFAKEIFDQQLGVRPSDKKFLITEPPNNPKKNREQLVDMMFEDFEVPKLYIGNTAVLSLFATGRTTGTVLDAGEGVTHAVPIYEGYAIPHAI
jgi:actin